ncbi:hypothetical protein Mal64_06350 [Pseudobythopirellula maris]|uniref:Uncharacterized protein n=1 Tax=Pseudobythopirellula maris TaxID=2527991 RepID=A0A5C5ZTS0_9BACT|nr:hypothetical protein Mal64_06350 [Pseudobythopirellula maris]
MCGEDIRCHFLGASALIRRAPSQVLVYPCPVSEFVMPKLVGTSEGYTAWRTVPGGRQHNGSSRLSAIHTFEGRAIQKANLNPNSGANIEYVDRIFTRNGKTSPRLKCLPQGSIFRCLPGIHGITPCLTAML